jgi:pSer/pThr/pTyr-binding forkhead associated (FHA) protein
VNPQEFDLTSLKKHSIIIGRREDCDLCLSATGVEEQHAILQAEKDADGIFIYLQPVAIVCKGYGTLRARTVLFHGDTFQVGTLNFQYLSDSGE